MTGWNLPKSITISGISYNINTDYRDILDVLSRLNNPSQDEPTRLFIAMALFYEDFFHMPEYDYPEAIRSMFDFIRCGEPEPAAPSPKLIDWEQDKGMIVADINKVSGCEVRALPFCHWWTFMAWFNAIGDGQLSTIVSIRSKRRKGKKLADWEREFYNENREKIDFKVEYTEAENEMLKQMLGK